MGVYQWLMQDLYGNKTEAVLSKAENTSPQEVSVLPKLSKELADFTTHMQQNFGMQVEYLPLQQTKEVALAEKTIVARVDYTNEIKSLEEFFSTCAIPSTPIELSKGEKIINVQAFIESHLSTIKNYAHNKYYQPYLERLQKLSSYLTQLN